MAEADPDEGGNGPRSKQRHGPESLRPTGVRATAAEVLHALKADWRKVMLAILGATIGLLAAELFDGSDDAKTVGAILGAAVGASLQTLADRFRWRARTLNALAAVLGVLAMPGARAWIVRNARLTKRASSPISAVSLSRTVAAAGLVASGIAVTIIIAGLLTGRQAAPRTPEAAIAAFAISHSWKERGWTYSGDCDDVPTPWPQGTVCSTPMPGSGRVFGARGFEHTYSILLRDSQSPVTVVVVRESIDAWVATRETVSDSP